MSVCLRHSGYLLSRIVHNEHNQVKGAGGESQVVSSGKKKPKKHSSQLHHAKV